MITKIKQEVNNYKGKTLHFKFNGSRNQTEEFEGIIENTYNYIFTVKIIGTNERIKSFTYSDILIENLEIIN